MMTLACGKRRSLLFQHRLLPVATGYKYVLRSDVMYRRHL